MRESAPQEMPWALRGIFNQVCELNRELKGKTRDGESANGVVARSRNC